MSNTIVQIRRSNTSATPTTTLNGGELAYSYSSNGFFIGAQTGVGTTALLIGGTKYGYVNNVVTPGTLAANATVVVDANSFISNTLTSGLMITTSALTPSNVLITSISNSTSSSILGANASGGGSGSELVTSQAIITYVSGKIASGGANTSFAYTWTNNQTFSGNSITFSGGNSSVTAIAANTIQANSLSTNGATFVANTTQVTISGIPLNANGSTGTAGYVLTTNGATGAPYWAAASAGLTGAQIAANNWNWSNTQTFQNTITFSSNVSIGVYANVGNVQINTTSISVAGNTSTAPSFTITTNSTTSVSYGNNTISGAPQFTIQNSSSVANLTSASLAIGNSSITSSANIVVQSNTGSTFVQVISGTGGASIANLSSTTLAIGSTVVQGSSVNTATVNAGTIYATTGFSGPYINVSGQVNAATIYATTSANIASAVQLNATGVWTTGTVNATTIQTGATFTANSTLVNATAVNITGQTNTATLFVTTSANIASSNVIANTSGVFVANATGVVNAFALKAGSYGTSSGGSLANTSVLATGNSYMNVVIGFNAGDSSIAEFAGNQNNYVEMVMWNANTGTQSSTDFIVFDSNGPSGNNFADFGMVGVNWSNSSWTISQPSDAYLYSANTNLSIGVASLGGGTNYVNFFTGGQLASNERMRITNSGNVGIGNTAPNATLAVTGTANISGAVNFGSSLTVGSYLNVTNQINTATLYVTTSANIASSNVIANTSGVFVANTSGVVQANLHSSVGSAVTPTTNVSTAGYVSGNSTVTGPTNIAIANTLGNTTINTTSVATSYGFNVNSSVLQFTGGNVSATSANLSVQNAIISGNLYVQGTLASINTTNLNINDNIIGLADENSPNYVSPSGSAYNTTSDVIDTGFISSAPIQSATNITANTTLNSANVQMTTTAGFYVGELITGTNIPANTFVTVVNSTNLIMSQVASGTSSVGTANAYYTAFYGLARVASSNSFSLFVSNNQIANPSYPANTTPFGATIGATQSPMPLSFLGVTSTQSGVTITANSTVNVNITANTLSLATALGAGSGGTGLLTLTSAAVLYGNGSGPVGLASAGANGTVLQILNNIPAFGGIDGGTF